MPSAVPTPTRADVFKIADRAFTSRLIIGTGKYRTYDEMKTAHCASGAEMVTVAV
ncbi:MAG: thiazole synthase, partial [Pyrinomonadaceae bacterium]